MRWMWFALVWCWGAGARAHDLQLPSMAQAPMVQAPIVQVPIVQSVPPALRHPYVDRRPSIFGFGMRGVFSGALVGLGASYFVARDAAEPWRAVGLSTSIGAVSGAALGLGLGIFDRLDAPASYAISRDLTYGILFGAVVGALCGGIVAIGGGDAEPVLLGVSAGTLSGVALGLATGILEGHWRTHHRGRWYGARRVNVSLAQVAPESRAWVARVAGSF
jgi:hypothetical protein